MSLPARRLRADGRPAVDVRAILRLAGPLMITNAMQSVLNLTDTWFLGRLSTDAVAAMSAIYWIMTCAILVLGGVGLAVQTFVAQAVGSRRKARASQAVWIALWASLATIPAFAALALAGEGMLAPFGLSATVERLALDYWVPRMYGAPIGLAAWAIAGFYNGVGATRITLVVAATTMLMNVPANQLFMFELGFGMAGAAWGTNVAQLTGLIAGLAFLLGPRFALPYRTRLTWRPRWLLIRKQLAIGLPVGVMYGADVLGVAFFQLMIAQIGSAPAAATQIVVMLTSLAYMPAIGIATAGTTFVGQAIGAGDVAWARRVGNRVIVLCVGFMLLMASLLLVTGRWTLPMFLPPTSVDAIEAVGIGLIVLWPAAAYQAFDGMYFGAASTLRGAGDTRVPAITALCLSWFWFVPLAHTLIFDESQAWIPGLPQLGMGALGGWIALMTYAMLLGTSMRLRWASRRWELRARLA